MLTGLFRVILASVVLAASVVQCANALAGEGRTIAVLADLSASTASARTAYEKYFKQFILGRLTSGDWLVIGQIGVTPTAEPVVDATIEIPGYSFLYRGGSNAYKRDVRKAKQGALKKFSELLAGSSRQTPILDTLKALHRTYAAHPNSSQILVLFSDMLESAPDGLDFGKERNLRQAHAADLVDRLSRQSRIPDLAGVKVYVAGARTPQRDRYEFVKAFWAELFRRSGAKLVDYGPDMQRFE